MTGYQEILTDPSYSRQTLLLLIPILAMSALMTPMKNFSGTCPRSGDSRPAADCQQLRNTEDLSSYLKRHNIVAIAVSIPVS